jgi:hypothetical protein
MTGTRQDLTCPRGSGQGAYAHPRYLEAVAVSACEDRNGARTDIRFSGKTERRSSVRERRYDEPRASRNRAERRIRAGTPTGSGTWRLICQASIAGMVAPAPAAHPTGHPRIALGLFERLKLCSTDRDNLGIWRRPACRTQLIQACREPWRSIISHPSKCATAPLARATIGGATGRLSSPDHHSPLCSYRQ